MGKIKPAALLRQSKTKKGPARPSIAAIAACNLVLVLVLLSIAFVSRQKGKHPKPVQDDTFALDEMGPAQYALLNTSKGLITLQLYRQAVPKAVNTFLSRSGNGYYDGGTIFRLRAGDNSTEGTVHGDVKGNNELGDDLKFEPFTFTLVDMGSKVDGPEFFIATGAAKSFNQNKRTLVGSVLRGEDFLEDIQLHPAELSDQPADPVVVYNIQLSDEL
jgi:cyclophilin family peptidyl-prolyl cis-trans isomerase